MALTRSCCHITTLFSTVSIALLASLALSACTTTSSTTTETITTSSAEASASIREEENATTLPINALPDLNKANANNDTCPYLDTQWVADTNGQRMTATSVDTQFSPPACVFWSYPDAPQLVVIVRTTSTADEATDIVDWAAPIDTTEPANNPEGWTGGRMGGNGADAHTTALGIEGAVYAVSKGTHAVVVFTNQTESFKAEQVALEVIKTLAL